MAEIKKQQKIQEAIESFKTKWGILFSLVRERAGMTRSRINAAEIVSAELKLQKEIQKTGFTISIKRKV